MERLYVHRVKFIRNDQGVSPELLPENPEQENMGIKYRFIIEKTNKTNAYCHGWSTGSALGGLDEGPVEGTIYAPKGFNSGELAFIKLRDPMIEVSKRGSTSIEEFLKNVDHAAVDSEVSLLEGFSLAGKIC